MKNEVLFNTKSMDWLKFFFSALASWNEKDFSSWQDDTYAFLTNRTSLKSIRSVVCSEGLGEFAMPSILPAEIIQNLSKLQIHDAIKKHSHDVLSDKKNSIRYDNDKFSWSDARVRVARIWKTYGYDPSDKFLFVNSVEYACRVNAD